MPSTANGWRRTTASDPDVPVDKRLDLVMQGLDPQLEKAVELVMQDIRERPKNLPPRPSGLTAYPKPKDLANFVSPLDLQPVRY